MRRLLSWLGAAALLAVVAAGVTVAILEAEKLPSPTAYAEKPLDVYGLVKTVAEALQPASVG